MDRGEIEIKIEIEKVTLKMSTTTLDLCYFFC
jgi:hypothetical protein